MASMEDKTQGDSPSSSSSHQATKASGWKRFLPERPLRVLLVEDDSATRQVVCALLSKCGYEVSPAADGLKAWNLLEHSDKKFDLILADAMMPFLSGSDLLGTIMSSEAHKDIPVIMMSSHDSLDVVFKCLLRGAKDFLVKPLRKNELRNLWQHVWRKNHASSRVGSRSDIQGKKRKAARMSSSGVSSDDFSVSSGIDAQHGRESGSAAQVVLQHDPELCQFQTEEKPSCGGLNIDQQVVEGKVYVPKCDQDTVRKSALSGHRADTLSNLEDNEASERLAKAIDLIGTMTAEPGFGENCWKVESRNPMFGMSQSHQPHPGLELTLRRTSSTENAQCHLDEKQGVQQSNYSAFSKYTNGTVLSQQQCIFRSASLPSDQGSLTGGASGIIVSSGDISRTTMEICPKANEREVGNGSCGSSTLHFPQAIHFHQSRQNGNSALSLLASCCDENGRQLAQEKSASSLMSPSLNSSTANSFLSSKETLLFGNGQICNRNMQNEAHFGGAQAGSVWYSTGSDKEDCSPDGDHLGHPPAYQSCTYADHVGPNQVQNTPHQENLHSISSDVEGFTNEERDTALHHVPSYMMASGGESNNCSDKGSNLHEEHQTGKSVNRTLAQDQCFFGGDFLNSDENVMMDFCKVAACDEGKVLSSTLLADGYRNTFREAALYKFRQKRKVRCFEKKVRYQSRKKLAEQRPRVKGQFVRQAVYDAAALVKQTM